MRGRRPSAAGSCPATSSPLAPSRDRGPQAADAGGDDGGAAGLRLERDQAERLVVAGDRDDGRPRGTSRASRRCAGRRLEPDDVGDAELARRAAAQRRSGCVEAAAAGAADDRDDQPARAAPGRGRSSSAAARSSTSGAFSGWRRPTNSSTTASGGTPRRVRAAEASPGRKSSRSTPGATRRPRRGRRRRASTSCARLRRRCWRSAGRRRRRPAPRRPRGAAARGRRRSASASVLDLGEGVRGVHQRHAPALGGEPADLAGQPVVRVDDVVPARLVGGLRAQHAGGERAQLRRAGPSLPSPSNGPAVTCRTSTPGASSTTGGRSLLVARVKTSTSTPSCGQPPGQLDDVDVHAAGVAGAGLVQRARCAPRASRRAGGRRSAACGRVGSRSSVTSGPTSSARPRRALARPPQQGDVRPCLTGSVHNSARA